MSPVFTHMRRFSLSYLTQGSFSANQSHQSSLESPELETV